VTALAHSGRRHEHPAGLTRTGHEGIESLIMAGRGVGATSAPDQAERFVGAIVAVSFGIAWWVIASRADPWLTAIAYRSRVV
jgi:hypothetical protein